MIKQRLTWDEALRGFTLVEVMLVSSIMAIFALAIFGLQDLFRQNQTTSFNTFNNVTEANNIVRQFTTEVRRARESENGTYALDTLEDNQIIFYSDIGLDGVVERVRYTLSGTTLVKGIIEPTGIPATYPTENETTSTLSENVQNNGLSLFEYYNGDWPSDTDNNPLEASSRISDTKQIRMFILINGNLNDEDTEYALDAFVNVRNL